MNTHTSDLTRRDFLRTASGTLAAAAVLAPGALAVRRLDTIRIGVVGCGGRGTGAVADAMNAGGNVRLAAMADMFPDRLASSRGHLRTLGDRAVIADRHCFTGPDAYRALLDEADVDCVLLCTPPGFRPAQFEAAIRAGKHVFIEKPVAVDAPGIRRVLRAGEEAAARGLCVVAGTQRRHERSYVAAMEHLRDGGIGEPVAARCFWNQGGLWVVERQASMGDLEWQVRNWLYFAWLSGDHIVEQHVHNLDVVNWAFGGPPVRAAGTGGRQVRTDPKYGHIYDHFAVEFEYPGNRVAFSMCRQQDGTGGRVEEVIHGTRGTMVLRPGAAFVSGDGGWRYGGPGGNPYVEEHRALQASILAGHAGGAGSDAYRNETRAVAESTLTAIMGREAAYTGKTITWDEMLASDLELAPTVLDPDRPLPVPPVPMPGRPRAAWP
ncbi:MAG: Gfo/Idh/MocA family oxidoreductase [Phycisphaeraceae bacterium]|nr:Gfo/Idh/MocA family oxidoreductase [Phycisphaeraceae bacterium]